MDRRHSLTISENQRDTTLTVATKGQYSLQTSHGKFKVHPFNRTTYIKYKFVAKEVPGGYFGYVITSSRYHQLKIPNTLSMTITP
jgi:hypothetical protein